MTHFEGGLRRPSLGPFSVQGDLLRGAGDLTSSYKSGPQYGISQLGPALDDFSLGETRAPCLVCCLHRRCLGPWTFQSKDGSPAGAAAGKEQDDEPGAESMLPARDCHTTSVLC